MAVGYSLKNFMFKHFQTMINYHWVKLGMKGRYYEQLKTARGRMLFLSFFLELYEQAKSNQLPLGVVTG